MQIIFSLLFMLSTAFGGTEIKKDVKTNSIEQTVFDTGGNGSIGTGGTGGTGGGGTGNTGGDGK